MANLVTQVVGLAGSAPTFGAAAGGGDTVACDGRQVMIVKNGGGAPITVTIDVPGQTSYGVAKPDKTYTVTNGTEAWIPMLADYRQANGRANVTYSAVTSVTVAVIQT